eukprot:TRINITY_DN49968_c0_g1_i1.p1 TRINITY_DN49968_c0_g1~~TRINITY_DN49968_c0_g1_i1.p1  ORF type:complete len:220 (+),score=14.06 TRINITY_DN49968_c0_g1_i1:34-660(+)
MASHNTTADLVFSHGSGGKLYLGPLPAAQNADYLASIECSHLVTVMYDPPEAANGLHRHHVKILDSNDAHMTPHVAAAVLQMDRWLASGTNVLVHCSSGISRSATLVLAYLIVAQHWSLKRAYEHTRNARQCIQPGNVFFNDLQELEVSGNGGLAAPSMGFAQYYGYTVHSLVSANGSKASFDDCVAAVERFGWETDAALMMAAQSLV